MNNPNPFVPQGSFLEQKNKARARLKIAVFSSISLSVVALTALLIQGCRKPAEPTTEEPTNNATMTPSIETSNSTPEVGIMPSNPPVTPVITEPVQPPPPPPPAGQEYTVIKGDTFATIAKKFPGVTTKAIQDANPTVDPKKLQIGQKLHIPASTVAPTVAPTATPGAPAMSAGGEQTYKVKSGDTLTTIAKKYHTTIKALQSANNLNSTSIRVGQVLKLPVTATAAPAPVPATVETTPTAPSMTLPPATSTNH
jgi:peptidoglycan endopeptidase LytE